MKNVITQTVTWFGSAGAVEQKFSTPFILSLMGHMVFCLLFIGLPHLGSTNKMPVGAINVQLVSAPAPGPKASAPEPEPKASEPKTAPKPAAPKPEPVVAKPKPKDAVSLAPKKEIVKKQSMKSKTYKPEQVVQSAIKNVEKRMESTKPDPIQQALDRIRANLKEGEKNPSTKDSRETNTAGTGGQGRPTSDAQLAYYAEIYAAIYKNWAYSEQLAGGETGLSNEMVIKIMRNGEISDVWFDRRSGNSYFDDSTYKAIVKSSPLPPIPNGIAKTSMQLGVRFSPEGLK